MLNTFNFKTKLQPWHAMKFAGVKSNISTQLKDVDNTSIMSQSSNKSIQSKSDTTDLINDTETNSDISLQH